jgi:hypothetical protein
MEIRTPPAHAHEGFPTRPNSLSLDPLLIELLKKIPPTESGWPEAQRVRWFRTFAMNVSQIYDNETPIELEIKVAKEAAN